VGYRGDRIIFHFPFVICHLTFFIGYQGQVFRVPTLVGLFATTKTRLKSVQLPNREWQMMNGKWKMNHHEDTKQRIHR